MSVETLPSSKALKTYEKLAVLRHEIEVEGDDAVAGKLTELFDKIRNEEFVIGFCGHFSAGKSTMINRIAGVDLLPSNPIPTSANLAKIRNNEKAFALIDYTNEDSVEMPYPYDLQEIRRSAIDGKVRSIEIAHPLEGFPPGVTLLDTPGIDSTDEAHLAATESALHLADIIFYVTDYNHVLSELNFAFLKQLQSQNKRVVLIVNQIDKHLSSELDFDDYRNGIARSFKEHDIEPEHIFYTSLKNEH
ncbi:MAG TPA: dynamin family protein, partial [Bacillales bacterium]|nr:dynamin family protein [Bacillales bacterium]